jgi:hypothetical protein
MPDLQRSSRVALAAVVIVLASQCPMAEGGITYLTQARSVSVYARADGEEVVDTETAPDFGRFEAQAQASIARTDSSDPDEPPNEIRGSGRVSQLSELLQAGIRTSGQTNVTADDDRGGSETNTVESLLSVTFRLDQEYDYVASATSPDSLSGFWRFELLGPGGASIFSSTNGNENSPVDEGVLAAGDYTFHADFTTEVGFGNESWNYAGSLDLTPVDAGPGPAPIPLPPAAWAALATMGGFGAFQRLRRRN